MTRSFEGIVESVAVLMSFGVLLLALFNTQPDFSISALREQPRPAQPIESKLAHPNTALSGSASVHPAIPRTPSLTPPQSAQSELPPTARPTSPESVQSGIPPTPSPTPFDSIPSAAGDEEEEVISQEAAPIGDERELEPPPPPTYKYTFRNRMGTALSLVVRVNGEQKTYTMPADGTTELTLGGPPRNLDYDANTTLGEQLHFRSVVDTSHVPAIREFVFSLPSDYFALRINNHSGDTIRQIDVNPGMPGGKSVPMQMPSDDRTYDVGVFKKQPVRSLVDVFFSGRMNGLRYSIFGITRHPFGYDYAVLTVAGGQ